MLIAEHMYTNYSISVSDSSYDGILAVTFKNNDTGYDFVVISAYLPPENSIYGRDATSFFSYLTNLIYLHCDYDAVYIAGDLNGRVGENADYIDQVDELPRRNVIDFTVNGHGEALTEFCIESKMCIINGRISPLKDNFTSVSGKGSAVVDYSLQGTSHWKMLLTMRLFLWLKL